ncbi:pilus assembly protein CpaF [Pseudomonas monteilii]|nr:pilus assembly protein CpaF [Pseudomonas monteilii]
MAWEHLAPDVLFETKSQVTSVEAEWREKTYQQLLKVMDLSLLDSLEQAEAVRQIRDICQRLLDEHSAPVSSASRQLIIKQITDEVLGLGPLEPLLADHTVSDILVNGHDSVYVERFGKLQRTDVRFRDDQHLLNIIDRIVSSLGRRIDESSPLVDARLKDGSRVNAIIPPLAIDGPSISIRRFAVDLLNVDSLIQAGALTPAIALLLKAIVRGRLNVLISGGTGCGKTTMLNVLSSFIPHNERIVTIEDSAELQLQQPHVVRLETRPANIEGRGEVGQRELVRNSLRMRPRHEGQLFEPRLQWRQTCQVFLPQHGLHVRQMACPLQNHQSATDTFAYLTRLAEYWHHQPLAEEKHGNEHHAKKYQDELTRYLAHG